MATEVAYPHIEKASGRPARLAGHPRIRIAQLVMDYLAYGWSAEEMCRQHEYLTPAEAHAALLYYWDHRDEVDAEIRVELDGYERDQARPSDLATLLKLHPRAGR